MSYQPNDVDMRPALLTRYAMRLHAALGASAARLRSRFVVNKGKCRKGSFINL